MAISLTFSRGAYFSLIVGIIFTTVILFIRKLLTKKFFVLVAASIYAIILSFVLLIASSSYRYRNSENITYNTTRSMLEHLTLGIIKLPEKSVKNIPVQEIKTQSTVDEFVPEGLVESSTNDRLGAADLALSAWSKSIKTRLIGVGPGNLGPFVVTYINPNVPNNLTVYIYYVLLLSELGLIGLIAFLAIFLVALLALYKKSTITALAISTILVTFLTQYLFFGSYINVVYIWLWLGIGLGWSSFKEKSAH